MRDRETIEREAKTITDNRITEGYNEDLEHLQLETLLDIRDLLVGIDWVATLTEQWLVRQQ